MTSANISREGRVGVGVVRAPWRLRWLFAGLAGLALAIVPLGSAPAQSPVSLAVVVHAGVPAVSLGAVELASIYTRATRAWKDGTTVRALNLPPGSPERVEFDRVVLDMSPERSAQFWIDKQIRGEEAAPKAIAQADIVARLVPTLSGAIGYLPEAKVDPKIRVIARIRGGKVVAP